MLLLNVFFHYSIFILIGICLLTLFFNSNKNPRTYQEQSNTQEQALRASLERLEKELLNTLAEKDTLAQENQRLVHELEANKHAANEKYEIWRQNKSKEAVVEEEIKKCPSKYYKVKLTLMNKPESRMFYYINESIKQLSNIKDEGYYILFPQVNLFSFFGTKANASISKKELELLPKVLGGKNIDFVLCYCHYDHYPSDDFNFYCYTPILMIEIDGPGHFHPIDTNYQNYKRTCENDQLKNTLADELKLPLLRYRLLDGKIRKADKSGINAALRKFFSDYNADQTESIYYYEQKGVLSKNQYYNPQ